jgi:D-arabinan exo alpha-(1,3)/(1,5)-arabinofuranosidase (non-reducing end)
MTTAGPTMGLLADLTRTRDSRSARASSWDQTGRNRDNWIIMPGEERVLADLQGPGCITHIWMTQSCRLHPGPGQIPADVVGVPMLEIHNALGVSWEVVDPDYYRKIVLKIYWDDQENPSVIAPLGDFFGLLNSLSGSYESLPLSVSAKEPEEYTFGGSAAFNSYFQMPFNRRARVVVENQNDVPYLQYFYIDYELYRESLPRDVAYFHAHYRQARPNNGWGPDLQTNSIEVNIPNLDGVDNYVALEVEGEGHYVGCNLAVRHFQGSWWGEGDDMIFIDDDSWPPSLHGTGMEDYFGHAWGMQRNGYLMNGTIVHEEDVPGFHHSYRFHLVDPIRFQKRIRVTFEHGHANHLSDDWSSTAYWYQKLPTAPLSIPPVAERLPLRPQASTVTSAIPALTADQQAARVEATERMQRFIELRDRVRAERVPEIDAWERGNAAQAEDIRTRFTQSGARMAEQGSEQ